MEVIQRAIRCSFFYFIYCMFAYDKNYIETTDTYVTYEWLFAKLIEICDDKAQARIREIVSWKLQTRDNVMWALLSHGMDAVACEFAIYYLHDCDMNMFLFAI